MIRRFVLAGLGLLLLSVASTSAAQDQFLLFEDLEVGMEGVGKTILRGNEIRTFQARIVSLIDSPGELNDFIEIRVSGDVIRESGGVAAGMSGSPIYVDGKLIGALSRAISFDSDPSPFALVTPIGPMLQLLAPARQLAADLEPVAGVLDVGHGQSGDATLNAYAELALVDALPSPEFRLLHPGRYYAVPIATPVLVSGMNGRAFDWLRGGLPAELHASLGQWLAAAPDSARFLDTLGAGLEARYPIQLVNTGLPGRQTVPAGARRNADDLVPGGAVGVTLASGDVSIGALGTVTHREDDIVLAFGHSFMFTGDVEYFLTRAYIYDTIANLQTPFKFGTTTERVGSLLQDRFQGIAGAVGAKPHEARLNVRLTDGESGEVTHYSVDLVRDNTLLASLVFSAGLSLLDQTLNRVGPGTLSIEYTIRGAGLPRRIEREDLFTSQSDIAVPGPLQVAQIIFLLAQNEFQDPELDTIDVDMTFIPEVRLARLVSIETDKESYRPGELVRYSAHFLPFRGDPFTRDGLVRIPDELQTSRVSLHAFGGPRPNASSNGDNGDTTTFEDLEEIIQIVERLSRNDYLTVELVGFSSTDLGAEDEPTDQQQVNDWVVSGEARVQLKIDHSEPAAPENGDEDAPANPPGDEDTTTGAGETDADNGDDGGGSDDGESSCDQLFFCD